jgi:hypothetical protein
MFKKQAEQRQKPVKGKKASAPSFLSQCLQGWARATNNFGSKCHLFSFSENSRNHGGST